MGNPFAKISEITIGAKIKVTNPSCTLLKWAKENLIVSNPQYAKKARMGLWLGSTPKTISLMEKEGDSLILPYGCLTQALLYSDSTTRIRKEFPDIMRQIKYGAEVALYDYQKLAVTAMARAYCGILQSPAGSGKTQMGIALIAKLGVKTLWLTHTLDLVKQSKHRAEQYFDKSLIGTITEGKVNIGEGVTFATVQTMSKLDLSQYRDTWDCIIVDEAHRVAGSPTSVTQFSKVLNSLCARYKYGLSATVHRSDGMIKATFALLGQVMYTVSENEVADKIMSVTVKTIPTHRGIPYDCLDTDGTIIYSKLINCLCEDDERNSIILDDLMDNAGHYNLVLSDRVSHLHSLYNFLPEELKAKASIIDGKMTTKKAKAEREQAIEDMRSGKKNYLFATYALAKEGLDIPRLDRLYLTTPQKDYAVVTQSIGRIARTFEGKSEPVAYDYVDDIKMLIRAYKDRCASYRKARCRIE